MNTTHVAGQPITIHEQRVDTFIADGPEIIKERHYGYEKITLNVSRVVTTYRQRDVGDRIGNTGVEHRVYARSTLKDGTPSNVETSVKERDWTDELQALLAQITDENYPRVAA